MHVLFDGLDKSKELTAFANSNEFVHKPLLLITNSLLDREK